MIFSSSLMSSVRFCKRPAVSISTTSTLSSRARVSASKASPAASAPCSRSTRADSVRRAQMRNCSTAAARKVSPAASRTPLPSALNLAASLPMVVVLPEPLTPMTRVQNGRLANAGRGGKAEVVLDEHVLKIVERGGVELALGKNVGHAARDGRRGARQPEAQALKPTLLRRGRRGRGQGRRSWGVNGQLGFTGEVSRLVFARSRRGRLDRRGRRIAAAEPAAQQARLPLVLVFNRRHKPSLTPPYARAADAAISLLPMRPEETRERLLYRDGLMLVFDKPAGVAVHAGPKGGGSLQDDFDALRFGLPRNPALAHRLDRDTAGCLVLGRHHKALEKLGLLFKQGKIAKTYWAIVAGAPEGEEGTIDLPLGRLDDKIGWWMKVDTDGQKSLTLWRVKGRGTWRGAPIAWLELEPKTGRTHQLRVHCASQGWPIFGDAIYGARADLPLQLLARKVIVPLSKSKPPIEVEAPAPTHMLEALAACGFLEETPAAV